jgi:hypothetical protein
MLGHHRSHGCLRPRPCRADVEIDGCEGHQRRHDRLFVCADPTCRVQVVICSDCDRGHIYCADCAPHARRRSLHQAGRRYQASSRGRINHAARSRRYRERLNRKRRNKVTHHGSPPDRSDAVLSVDPVVVERGLPLDNQRSSRGQQWYCIRCGRRCSAHVRQDFLRRRVRWHRRKGPESDDSSRSRSADPALLSR